MSTSFYAVCDVCKEYIHCGQRSANTYSFGYGSNDEKGRALVAEWICKHAFHEAEIPRMGSSRGVRVIVSHDVPVGYVQPEWDAT